MRTHCLRTAQVAIEHTLKVHRQPRVMVSFGKDSTVLVDMLSHYGVRDVLFLEDRDEVIDRAHIAAVIKRYQLRVTTIGRGRALFFMLRDNPYFISLPFITRTHATVVPTNIVPWAGEATYTCVDEELSAQRGTIVLRDADVVFDGFKLQDIQSNQCRQFLELLSAGAHGEYMERVVNRGIHGDIAPGLPACSPMFHWLDDDVWEYIRIHDVPWSRKVYDDEGQRRPAPHVACFRCHNPNGDSIVECPRIGAKILNFAALANDTDLRIEYLRRLGYLDDRQAAELREVA